MTLAIISLPPANNETIGEIFKLSLHTIKVRIESVGKWFESYNQKRNRSSQSFTSIKSTSSEEDEDVNDVELCSEDECYVLSRDPSDWKNQDHYKILGLSNLRYRATDKQIKLAYKKKVLHHHPDKRKARGIDVDNEDDDYFSCITRASEILGNPIRRRAYDSIDPEFDDSIPNIKNITNDNFYTNYGPVFERNSRWSVRKKVPMLGNENTAYEDVCEFYNFWYEFTSWRDYSYLDEEDKDKGENRDERRWIDKQNKSARLKRKKDEMVRIRSLVDGAYSLDPRIIKQKEEEKQKKLALKQARKEEIRKRIENENKLREEEEDKRNKIKQLETHRLKAEEDRIKKERDVLKNKMKKKKYVDFKMVVKNVVDIKTLT